LPQEVEPIRQGIALRGNCHLNRKA
jgi:hypothetical protein